MSNIIEINDLNSPILDVYLRLTENKLRNRLEPQKGIFIAESPKVIEVAIKEGYTPLSFLMEKRHIYGDAKNILSKCSDVPVYTSNRETLGKITGYTLTRGVLCAMKRPPLPSLEEICKDSKRIAVLENVVDATNIGAIMRSAAALNMDAVLLNPTCCDALNRRAIRVSMGTVFQIPWTYICSTHEEWEKEGINILHSLGFKTAAMALRNDTVSIDDKRLLDEEKLAIVLGAEGDGLSEETIASCDYTVKIPMAHNVDSLNVAAASAVAFWELRKR